MSNALFANGNASAEPVTVPITTEQFEILVNAGTFEKAGGQIELIHGRIVRMNSQGPEHADPLDVLAEWSIESVQRRYTVRIEKPIRVPEQLSCPEPDIAWVTRRRYYQRHPEPSDVQLLIEVSPASSHFDRTEKLRLYAAAGICEYWQIDIASRTAIVHRHPDGDLFRWEQSFDEFGSISPLCLPEAKLVLATLFPRTSVS